MNYESTLRQRVQNSDDIKTGTIKVWFNVHDTKKWNRRWNKHLNSLPYVILRYIPTWHRMKLHDLTERHNKKNPTSDNKQMKPAYISSLSFLPVLATFKHNFLARSLLSAYKCRGHLHDDVTSKFTGTY